MMQTLWNRVAQVRGSCRCPQCLSASTTAAVSRRAAASATRRTPAYWTSSTLWYSGIFAAAATFDAGIKIQRRERWDLAIAEVEQELGQAARVEQNTGNLQQNAPDATTFEGKDTLRELEANLDSSSRRKTKPRWPTNTGPELDQGHLPPQSIYSPRSYKSRAESQKWSERKLEVMQLSVDLLQLRLWHSFNVTGWTKEAVDAVPAAYAESFHMTPERLFAALVQKRKHLSRYSCHDNANKVLPRPEGDLRLCNYHQHDSGHSHETAHSLNISLQHLFARGERQDLSIPAVLAKVYFNLSTSSAPPNVDTFNTLIIGLSKLNQDARVREVIAAFKQTFTRPNEVSLASILDFYNNTGDARSFRYWVHLMRGKYGGLMAAHRNVYVGPSSQGRLIRDPDNPEKIIQLPYPTPIVFAALINGVLHFSGFDAALKICEGMSQQRWGLCISGLQPLLKNCADRRDWVSGLAIWKQIQALQKRTPRQEKGHWTPEVIELPTFAVMLRLCTNCDKEDYFRHIMNAAIRAHPNAVSELRKILVSETPVRRPGDAEAVDPCTSDAAKATTRHYIPDDKLDTFSFRTPWADLACEEGSIYLGTEAADATKDHVNHVDANTTSEETMDEIINLTDQQVLDNTKPVSDASRQLLFENETSSTAFRYSPVVTSTEHSRVTWRRRIESTTEQTLAPVQMDGQWERPAVVEIRHHPITYAL